MLASVVSLMNFIVVGLCTFIKFPQILTLHQAKCAAGISLTSIMLELWGYSTVLTYSFQQNYVFMTYAEYFFLVLQDLLLLMLVLKYLQMLDLRTYVLLGVMMFLQSQVALGTLPMWLTRCLLMLCIPIFASSKILQLTSLIRSKSSSQISITTWMIAVVTSTMRIFTTILETNDMMMVINLVISLTLNLMIVASTIFYRTKPVKTE